MKHRTLCHFSMLLVFAVMPLSLLGNASADYLKVYTKDRRYGGGLVHRTTLENSLSEKIPAHHAVVHTDLFLIEPGVTVAADSVLGRNIWIRAGTHVSSNVVIGKDSRIGADVVIESGVQIGLDVQIGNKSSVGHGAILRDRVILGKKVEVGPKVKIREGLKIADRMKLHLQSTLGWAVSPQGTFLGRESASPSCQSSVSSDRSRASSSKKQVAPKYQALAKKLTNMRQLETAANSSQTSSFQSSKSRFLTSESDLDEALLLEFDCE